MFCKECGKELSEQAKSCPWCGQQTVSNIMTSNQNSYSQTTQNYQILARSVSCKNKLEEWKKNFEKTYVPLIFLPVIIMLFREILNANEKQNDIPSIPGFFVISAVYTFTVIIILIKKGKPIMEQYTQYKGYCSTEELLVDMEKVYGSTSKGKMALRYEQIKDLKREVGVTTQQQQRIISYTFVNDVLKIEDVAGNYYYFYSFDNCQELSLVIQHQIERKRSV